MLFYVTYGLRKRCLTVFPPFSEYTVHLFITLNSHVCSSYKNVLRSDEEHEENEDGEASVGTDANATAA